MIITKEAVARRKADLEENVALLSGQLNALEADSSSYDEEGAYTMKAYKNKVALEQAVEGLSMAINNLNDIVVG